MPTGAREACGRRRRVGHERKLLDLARIYSWFVAHLRRSLPVFLASGGLVFFVATRAARADGTEPSAQIAQALFDDGRALMDGGRYAEACPKFAESHRIDPAGGTLLNLALCHELEGKTASAWTEFRDALSIAIRDQRRDRQDLAEQHIIALAPKLVRLTIVVPEAVASTEPEITFDRARLPSAAWNTTLPVDPGMHRLAVVTPGRPRWKTAVATTEPGRTYRVELAPLEGPPPPATTEQPTAPQRSTAFWFLLGGAGVSLATSVVTGALALGANAYVKDNCSSERAYCRVDDAGAAADRARALAWASTATLITTAGAVVVALLLPRATPRAHSP